ncbi:MAG TPA: hydroxyisourate hydrolase [Hansschlegelia sp.]
MGRLTTHILDTERGRPANGVAIDLLSVGQGGAVRLASAVTNEDGRTPAPLLEGEAFSAGLYELHFHVGPYLARTGRGSGGFLDTVVVRFGVASGGEDHHVPLLLQANGYSIYRGS